MPLDVQVIERKPVPDGRRFWDVVAGLLSRAARPTATRMQLRAPHGKTGKLARRVDVRVVRVNQGLVQGVQLDFIVAVPYGHLVTGGHRIIPRGRSRGTRGAVIGSKQLTVTRHWLTLGGQEATRQEVVTRAVRSTRRAELLQRRGRGSIGFVPANPFASATLQETEGQIVRAVEDGLTHAV